MKFRKFSSIENSYRQAFVQKIVESGYDRIPYIVTEKIHGANFSFWVSNDEIRIASRSQFVDENFYSCKEVVEKYRNNLSRMKRNEFPNIEYIAVYGELYGPGIQKGIYYGKEKNFAAFEVSVNSDPDLTLSVKYAKDLLNKYEIPFVPILGEFDSLQEALEYPNEFDSKVPVLLNNCDPSEIPSSNICEGVVISPMGSYYLPNGNKIILKNKNEKWGEKQESPRGQKTRIELETFGAENYINENRMNAVISKIGGISQKDFGRVIREMSEDVVEEMVKDGIIPDNWRSFEGSKSLGKAVTGLVSIFLKKELFPKL